MKAVLPVIISLLILATVTAQLELPPGVLQIKEYNQEQANFYFENLTFFIAFIAGMLSIFSPCLLPTLPAFFAYTFKERKNITKMTLAFFFGFTIVFVSFGIIASLIGQSLVVLQRNYSSLVLAAGLFLIIFGVMALAGRGFSSFIKPKRISRNDTLGVFLMGLFFAIGWSACLGPILAGVLLMASVLKTYVSAALLLLAYSLGIFVPLFILSFVFDKFNLAGFLSGKAVHFKVSGKERGIHITNLISGLLLIAVGIIFIVFKGTSVLNSSWIFNPELFYRLQERLFNIKYINFIGAAALAVFVLAIALFIRKKNRSREG